MAAKNSTHITQINSSSSSGGSVTSNQSNSSSVSQTATSTDTPPPTPITEAFRFGTLENPSINPATGNVWDGTGNSPGNYNITDSSNDVETGLAVKVRGGATYMPDRLGADGQTQEFSVMGGLQPGSTTRADFNIDYDVNTAAGIAPNDTFDLTNAPGLAAYNFKMTISQEGPNFAHPVSATFDLNASTHVWTDETNPSISFGGDDFQPDNTASALVQSHVATNSINFGFAGFQTLFGPLATSVAPGAQYAVSITGSAAGATPTPFIQTNDLITLHG